MKLPKSIPRTVHNWTVLKFAFIKKSVSYYWCKCSCGELQTHPQHVIMNESRMSLGCRKCCVERMRPIRNASLKRFYGKEGN